MWGEAHESLVLLVCLVVNTEYKDIWPPQLVALETWLVEHDAELQPVPPQGV